MSALEEFKSALRSIEPSRLRTTWLIHMFRGQAEAFRLLSERFDRPGLEHLTRQLMQCALRHENLADKLPVKKMDAIVGKPEPQMFTAWTATLTLERTNPDIDGFMVTGLRNVLTSRSLIQFLETQNRFTSDLDSAVDESAALLAALDRAEDEIRQFWEASRPNPTQ